MLCQNCNINQATILINRNVNGENKQYHLCHICAVQIDVDISFDKLFQGFLDTFFQTSSMPKTKVVNALVCDKCGFTYEDFKNKGKLGCGACYKTFKHQLLSVLNNIQGSTQHNGKFPKKFGVQMLQQHELDNLKIALRKAIDSEEYEEAATLRDKIKALEGTNE